MANLDLTYSSDDRTQAFENHAVGFLISLAGPGTGKTYSFLKRTQALTSGGVSQDSICYLTFIKEISNSFIEDYIEEFGRESYEANKPRISTLHSFACRLLRNQGFQIGYDGELYFINTTDPDSDDANTVLSDLRELVNGVHCPSVAQLRKHINCVKSAWRDEVDPLSLPDPIPSILPQAENLFKAFRVVDWDQTIPLALALARSLQRLPIWITNLKHYFIDEYQDFNKAEQSLIFFLSAQATSVVIVGDDNQSLYRTRGGSPEGLRRLYADPSYDQVSLVKCFRCREAIVSAANIFQSSMNANPRVMLPSKNNGQIFVYRFKSSKAELVYLTTFLQSCIAEMPQIPRSKDGTVCLFPSWRVLNAYYEKLSQVIPCIRRKANIQPKRLWLEHILHLVCSPNQRFLERLLLNYYPGIKPRHKRMIVQRVVQRDISVLSAVQSLLSEGCLSGSATEQSRDFSRLVGDITSQDASRVAQHVSSILAVDTQTVQPHISAILERLDEPEKEDLIEEFCDLILPESAEPPEDPQSILFLTMHGSKGLTKKNVVIPGLEAAWLPGDSLGSELDEKRRLFYVAFTRATDRVLMTFPLNRGRNDSLNFAIPGRNAPSPFIADAGLCDIYYH